MERIHLNIDTTYVPHHIIKNILLRLQVKSLLRFKTVSKTWKTTISEPIFTRTHLQHIKNSTRQNLYLENVYYHNPVGKFKLLKVENEECCIESMLDYPSDIIGRADLLSCCDGLALLRCQRRDDHKYMFVVWNPSTRTCIMSPSPHQYSLFSNTELYGFCYDPFIDDYKAIMVYLEHYSIFHCRNNYWTESKRFSPIGANPRVEFLGTLNCTGVYYDGALYWVLMANSQLDDIVCYDIRNDKFKMVQKPDQDMQHITLSLLGGHLVLSDSIFSNSRIQMFMMKKHGDHHSWAQFATIDFELTSSMRYNFVRPILLISENEIVLETCESDHLVVYNMINKAFTKIQKNPLGIYSFSFPYLDSLISF